MTAPIAILVAQDEPLVSMALVDDLEIEGFVVVEAVLMLTCRALWMVSCSLRR
jgi:hypothetical protein